MMAAYQPTPGVGHPGLPHGHPGMASNPGQHMGQTMQMHPGVSGAPHVTQPGAMMAMQPGAMNAQHPGAGMAMQAQLAAHGMQNPQLGQMTPAQLQHLQQQQQQAAQLTAQMGVNGQNPAILHQQRLQMMRQQQAIMQANGMSLPQGMTQQQMISFQQAQAQAQAQAQHIPPHVHAQMQARQAQLMQQQQAQQQLQQAQQAQQQQQQAQQAAQPAQNQQAAQQQQAQQQAQQQQAQQHQQQLAQQQQQQAQQQQAQQQQAQQQQAQQQQAQQQVQQQQAQQQQAQAQQAQAQAQQQQQQQQQNQQQQQQAQAQQQQHHQLQQQLAMQHANSQQSNQGQPNTQNQPSQQNTPAQMRPQSRTANPGEPNQTAHPQTPQPSGPQNAAQAQATPQQVVQQSPQITTEASRAAVMNQLRRAQLNQQRAGQVINQQAQASPGSGGMYILKVMQFSDQLCGCQTAQGKDITIWHKFVERHFAPDGYLLHSFENDASGRPKVFEVLRDSIARYFWTYFESGAQSLRLHTENAREIPFHPGGGHIVNCSTAILTVTYPNGVRLEMNGSLRVVFTAGSDLIDSLHFQTSHAEESISRTQIEKIVSEWEPAPSVKSPTMTKGKLPKAQKKAQEQPDRMTMEHFPKTYRGTLGVSSRVQHFLEIGETMSVMADIMSYSQEHSIRSEKAMEALATQYETAAANPSSNPQLMQANGIAAGNRTPAMQNRPMPPNGMAGGFASPSMPNLNLPMQPNGLNGSPHLGNPGLGTGNMMGNSHTPSPHLSNMAAPPMIPQHSAQGTNSSTASANTSPNVNNTSTNNNKRRRSTVKMEGDEAGADAAPTGKVKPSPRMTKKQRP